MSLPNEAAGAMPDESRGPSLADAEVVDALREEVQNGKPVEWRRLVRFENLTPLQAAIAARGMDPFRWTDGTLNAQGETLPAFREQTARLEQWLRGRRAEWSLAHLVEALGDRAPIGMREAVQSATRAAQAKELEREEAEAARRNAGFFTLEEAAEALGGQLAMHSGARGSLLERMREAVRNGNLTVRDPHTKLPYRPAIVRDFYERVTPDDVNAWLEQCRVAYRWEVRLDAPEGSDDALQVVESAEGRQARRLAAFRASGGLEPAKNSGRWKGVGRAAQQLGISRQALTEDLTAALEREREARRMGPFDPALLGQ